MSCGFLLRVILLSKALGPADSTAVNTGARAREFLPAPALCAALPIPAIKKHYGRSKPLWICYSGSKAVVIVQNLSDLPGPDLDA